MHCNGIISNGRRLDQLRMNSTSPCLPGSLPKAEWSAKTERFASWKAMGGNGKLLDVEGHWVRKEDQ